MHSESGEGRRLLTVLALLAVAYAMAVLGTAASTFDMRVRCLLTDEDIHRTVADVPGRSGVVIRAVLSGLGAEGPRPAEGDRITGIARRPIRDFSDYADAIRQLRTEPLPVGSDLGQRPEPLPELSRLLPAVVVRGGARWVEVEFCRAAGPDTPIRTWLRLRSLPAVDLAFTLTWFACHCVIMALAALAFWKRPFDRAGRLFFAMCSVTLVAFIGGYQWWVIADSPWLTLPFIVGGVLLPAVTLHFFLVYPEPKAMLSGPRGIRMVVLYGPPTLLAAWLSGLALVTMGTIPAGLLGGGETVAWLSRLEQSIQIGFILAVIYFAGVIVALVHSVRSTRNPLVQSQVKGILWAAMLAAIPVSYSLYLAVFDRQAFALGHATPPMFVASLLFMVAYGVGMARYKLMLVDELLSQGMRFVVLNIVLSIAFAVSIALVAILAALDRTAGPEQSWPQAAVIAAMVLLILGAKSRAQLWIDRRYFREKYPLDRVLGRINQALGRTAEPEHLAERMLATCREALQVDHAALYLRDDASDDYQLVAVDGLKGTKWNWPTDQELLRALRATNASRGVEPGLAMPDGASSERASREHRTEVTGIIAEGVRDDSGGALISQAEPEADDESAAARVLRDLNIQLVHSLWSDEVHRGLVLLGPKRNGASFSAEDLAFLTALGQITGVALQTARVRLAISQMQDESRTKSAKISEQQRLIQMLQAELSSRQGNAIAAADADFDNQLIKGSSPTVVQLLDTVRKVATTDSTVLIRGESGTGKELLARTIHLNSGRREAPLVAVHCGALSPSLLESELFGHVKGAFTGATADRKGRFELAHGGTLFLDEIGDISMETQIKLLRVLQERSFEPVGGSRTVEVDVRLITATHQDLEKLIRQGKFREDLYYRLNVISVVSPALRDRDDDVIELAEHFLREAAARMEKPVVHFDDEAIQSLRLYRWPGNVRELQNVIERAVVLADGPTVGLAELPVGIAGTSGEGAAPVRPRKKPRRTVRLVDGGSLPREFVNAPTRPEASPDGQAAMPGMSTLTRHRGEKGASEGSADELQAIVEALRRAGGNKAQAARLLGMPRSTLFSKLTKYGLEDGPPPKG